MKLPKLKLPELRWSWFPWVLAVVLLGTTLTNWWLLRSERHDDSAIETVSSTARAFLNALTNYKADTIQQNVSTIEGFAVGQFAEEVRSTFDAEAIARIRRDHTVATGRIWNVSLQALEDGTAKVRAILYETVAKQGKAPVTDVFQLEIGMVDTVAGWKVDRVRADILQAPGAQIPGGTA